MFAALEIAKPFADYLTRNFTADMESFLEVIIIINDKTHR